MTDRNKERRIQHGFVGRWVKAGAAVVATASLCAQVGAAPAIAAQTETGHAAKRTAAALAQFPVALKDQAGVWMREKTIPTRIASLTLGADEVLMSLIPPKDIIGVDPLSVDPTYSHIVSQVKHDHLRLMSSTNAEAIIAAHPDLILVADYNSPTVIQQLRHTGIPVYEFANFNSMANIEQNILILGRLTGTERKAQQMVSTMNAQFAAMKKTAPKKRLSVFYVGYQYAAGSGTTANSVIKDAGGVNAAAGFNGWQKVSVEQMIKLNPDVIVIPDDSGAKDLELKQFLATPGVQALRAVKDHHVYTASDGDLSAVSQYVVQGVRDMQQILLRASRTP